jgi:hypothetical protein
LRDRPYLQSAASMRCIANGAIGVVGQRTEKPRFAASRRRFCIAASSLPEAAEHEAKPNLLRIFAMRVTTVTGCCRSLLGPRQTAAG